MRLESHVDCSKGLTFHRPSLVKVQFADECDLGKIVKRFIRTGELPNLSVKKPLNVDATQLPDDFQDLQQWRIDLSNAFEKESQAVKDFCQHDLERYAEFKSLSEEERQRLFASSDASVAGMPKAAPPKTLEENTPNSSSPLPSA